MDTDNAEATNKDELVEGIFFFNFNFINSFFLKNNSINVQMNIYIYIFLQAI